MAWRRLLLALAVALTVALGATFLNAPSAHADSGSSGSKKVAKDYNGWAYATSSDDYCAPNGWCGIVAWQSTTQGWQIRYVAGGTSLYIYRYAPFAGDWTWIWTQRDGWLATQRSGLSMKLKD